jgi:hypothetical protein
MTISQSIGTRTSTSVGSYRRQPSLLNICTRAAFQPCISSRPVFLLENEIRGPLYSPGPHRLYAECFAHHPGDCACKLSHRKSYHLRPTKRTQRDCVYELDTWCNTNNSCSLCLPQDDKMNVPLVQTLLCMVYNEHAHRCRCIENRRHNPRCQ